MLRIENLRKKYGKKEVLKGINLQLEGGFWALIGKNGAGKTTLLKCLMAMVPFEGTIEISGKDVKNMSRKELAKKIGYVPQMSNQDVPLSVREFLEIGAYYRGGDIENVLKIISYDSDRMVNTLSGGEFQKLLIARAMIGNPEILLLDEPANHLDIKNTADIVRILREYSKKALVIAVVHDLNLLNFVDGVIAMKDGRARVIEKIDSSSLREIFDANVDVVVNGKYRFVVPRYNGVTQ